jgi:hypothetical protein
MYMLCWEIGDTSVMLYRYRLRCTLYRVSVTVSDCSNDLPLSASRLSVANIEICRRTVAISSSLSKIPTKV